MSYQSLITPASWRRQRTLAGWMAAERERVRAVPWDERHLRIPGERQPSPGLGPPAGMFVIRDGEKRQP